jgi:ferrous iron transport protein B
VSESGAEIWMLLSADFTALSAYSFLIFNLICAPCFAAIGAIKREMGSKKWTLFAISFQTGLAYAMSLIIYQVGSILNGTFNVGSIFGLLTLLGLLVLLFRPNPYRKDLETIKV